MRGNREYKSDVFSMLMQEKSYALQVYNAINCTDYSDPDLVEMKRLEGGFSLSVRNDAAFVVNSHLNIYEHQSTPCPNMPLRSLIYFADTVSYDMDGDDIFGNSRMIIPEPQFIVFYNGKKYQPEYKELRLSDLYATKNKHPLGLELVCRVYNINKGNNTEFMKRCKVLSDYMYFVDMVRDLQDNGLKLSRAIDQAIRKCTSEGVLVDFFRRRRSEVKKVMQLDYTVERRLEIAKNKAIREGMAEGLAEGREKGMAEGRAEGRSEGYREIVGRLLAKGKDVDEVADMLDVNANIDIVIYQ